MNPSEPIKFIDPDEIELRIRFKEVLKHEGAEGLLMALGEINASFIVGWDILLEHYEERAKKGLGPNGESLH